MTNSGSIQLGFRRIRYLFAKWQYWLFNGLPTWVYTAFFVAFFAFLAIGVSRTIIGMTTIYNNNLRAFIAEDPSRFKTLPQAAAAYEEIQEEARYQEYLKKHHLGGN